MWRVTAAGRVRGDESREEFLAYPQTSPEIYAWLPYHREPPGGMTIVPRRMPQGTSPTRHERRQAPPSAADLHPPAAQVGLEPGTAAQFAAAVTIRPRRHSRKPPRNAKSLLPRRAPFGIFFSLRALPPPSTT